MINSEKHARSPSLCVFARAVDALRRERGLSEAKLGAIATSDETDPGTMHTIGWAVSDF